jgi:hypothetical protein
MEYDDEVLSHVYGDAIGVRAHLLVHPESYQPVLDRLVQKGHVHFSDATNTYQVTSGARERLEELGLLYRWS